MKLRFIMTISFLAILVTTGFSQDGHNHDSDEIHLDNGSKWKVVDHMMAHIINMENDVKDFKGETLTDYNKLGEKLLANIVLLTSNCTMTGQAHDELHVWLLPYIDLVNEFAETKTYQVAVDHYKEIQDSFVRLNKYFK